MPSPAAALRRLGLMLFRAHIGNGLAVLLGLVAVGLGFYAAGGLGLAVAASTGALCMSIADQPGPLRAKPIQFGVVLVLTTLATLFTGLARGAPWSMVAAIAGSGFLAGLMTAYGKRAIGPGIAMILALVLAMGSSATGNVPMQTATFAAGAVAYGCFALLFGFLFEDFERRLLLIEALLAFSHYLRAKAELYDPGENARKSFRSLIDAHAFLIDKLQAARDALFDRLSTPRQRCRADALIALSDAFEVSLSSDADLDLVQRSNHHHLMRRIERLILDLAHDAETLSIMLHNVRAVGELRSHDVQLEEIAGEIARIVAGTPADAEAIAAFRSTQQKLGHACRRMTALAAAIASDGRAPPSATLDLIPFMQPQPSGLAVLAAQFSLSSPALRYAIRLTLAMVAGYALTLVVPRFAHPTWVLLTVGLIMRANYSVTRQRRTDRVVGTLIGCVLAAGLIHVVPFAWLTLIVVASLAVSHAYGAVAYRVTAVSASITALLLLHLLAPNAHPLFTERLLDTVVGAAISYLFGFLLPSWERRDLPRMIANLLAADAEFARAALTTTPVEQQYRLARKRVLDAVGNMSGAARRLSDEPNGNPRVMASLNELLGANYLLASDIASVQVLLKARADGLQPAQAAEALDTARTSALSLLADAKESEIKRLRRRTSEQLVSMTAQIVLRRRLAHIERTAARVAALAARTLSFAKE